MPRWARLPVLVLIIVVVIVLCFEVGTNSVATWCESMIVEGAIGFVAGYLIRQWDLI